LLDKVRRCSSGNSTDSLPESPPWQYEQIGIVKSQGAQVASDATVYSELQSQAAKLGAEAVLVVSGGMKQYGSFPGIATYNANGNLYGNNALVGGRYRAAIPALRNSPM
jgi:hypothetical protein